MKTITFKDGKCTSDPIDKSIFNGMNSTIVHVISDNTDYNATCGTVCRYIGEAIGEAISSSPGGEYHDSGNSLEITLQIHFN